MEADKLQNLHDQLKSGQSRRGRKGGLGGVAGEGGNKKGTQTFFAEEGESELYANFVKGKTLNATRGSPHSQPTPEIPLRVYAAISAESKCRVILDASEESEGGALTPKKEKKFRQTEQVEETRDASASDSDAQVVEPCLPPSTSPPSSSKRKRRRSTVRVPLIGVALEGKKTSVLDALREAAPSDASHVLILGGSGTVSKVEMSAEHATGLRVLKKCRLCHVQGTVPLADSEDDLPSLFGLFATETSEEASLKMTQGSFSLRSLKPSKSSVLKLWGLPVCHDVSEE